MILLIDNYDSFTYNLVHYLGELGAEVRIERNDTMTAAAAMALKPKGIVLSPGPCDPDKAGICMELVGLAAAQKTPLLGVCLGHQAIAQAMGGKITRAADIVHGKMGVIHHDSQGLFKDIPTPFEATRYHSLIVEKNTFPNTLTKTAWLEDGTIMALQHKTSPLFGVQFHPESIASEHGHHLLRNFLQSL